MDGRRGRDGKVKQVEGLILLLMFYESYVESYLLTLTALEVQPWPESLLCVDILYYCPHTHPFTAIGKSTPVHVYWRTVVRSIT